jgi:ribonuclease-3
LVKLRFISFFRKKKPFEKKIKNIVGYKPNDVFLFQLAMVHKSVVYDSTFPYEKSNERLELLGDAVLGMLVAEYLYDHFPDKNEGDLTKMRSLIVSRTNLNKIAIHLGLNDILISNQKGLFNTDSVYGNAFEALVGAIYLDAGLKRTKKFIYALFKTHINLEELIHQDPNYKSRLIEWAQAAKIEYLFETKEFNRDGRDQIFECKLFLDKELASSAMAKNKKKAEQNAAFEFFKSKGNV